MSLRDFLFGRPISTDDDEQERIGPVAGVGVLGLDALASAAYGPEALLTVLLPAGVAALRYVTAMTLVIVTLIAIVGFSYRQTIHAYPNGGGAYTVAKDNLGTTASLLAAASLALDYTLNVAVAISAGVGALVSAVPSLLPHTLPLCLAVLALLTVVNLRGLRSTGLVFLLPTYTFLGSLFTVIAIGAVKAVTYGGHVPGATVSAPLASPGIAVSGWLLMRAFANGCTAMTGIEAVSNGVPVFRSPSEVGARRTLSAILVSLVTLLIGIALLSQAYGITATEPGRPGYESVLSRLTGAVVGRGVFYYFTTATIIGVLASSANTSFADFPRVCQMLAGDRFLPESFVHRGRRLTFSYGILVLALLSAVLLVGFQGITDRLIPLFAVGALAAFTMSQVGMIAHWRKQRGARAIRALVLNAAGALATLTTLVVVLVSKFAEGAWISAVLVLSMIVLLRNVRAHYDFVSTATATTASLAVGPPYAPLAVVPMRHWDLVTLKALRFAIGLSEEVVAVQVLTGDRDVDDLSSRWNALVVEPSREEGRTPPRLVVLHSEYRKLYAPFLDFVTGLEREHPDRPIAVIVPELVEPRWYHHLLHDHAAPLMKALLLFRGGTQTVVVSVPWYLREWRPEHGLLRRRHRTSQAASRWWHGPSRAR